MKTSTLLRTIWLLAGAALLLGIAREPVLAVLSRAQELPRMDGAMGMPWVSGGFVRPGDPQEILAGRLAAQIPRVSSWVDGDAWQGQAETPWFQASSAMVQVAIAGYPRAEGCDVWAEFRTADGRVTRLDCPLINPRE